MDDCAGPGNDGIHVHTHTQTRTAVVRPQHVSAGNDQSGFTSGVFYLYDVEEVCTEHSCMISCWMLNITGVFMTPMSERNVFMQLCHNFEEFRTFECVYMCIIVYVCMFRGMQ